MTSAALRPDGPAAMIAWGAASDRGARRTLNEDAYVARSPVFVVADGMGGHDAGELASARTVAVLGTRLSGPDVTADDVRGALAEAHRAVQDIVTAPGRAAGTTVSGVVLTEVDGLPYWIVVNLGDSRTYRLSDHGLEQVSVDHSEVQELIDLGEVTVEEAAHHPRRHVVTRALGAGVESETDFWLLPVGLSDRILVCSDGLTGELRDDEVREILLSEPDPQAAADRLVREAVQAGGRDNVTVVVIDVRAVTGQEDSVSVTSPRTVEVDDDTLPGRRTATEPGGVTGGPDS